MSANHSVAELVALLPDSEQEAALREIAPTRKDEERLLYEWSFWARPAQLPPPGDWFVWFIRSGRGFGKTRTGAEYVIERAKQKKGPIALVGQTKADVRDTMIEVGESSIMQRSPPWFRPVYEPSKRRLVWPNGSVAIVYSGDEPDQLRGPQHQTAWVDELAKFQRAQDAWDNLEMGMRVGDPRICCTSTPRPIDIVKKLVADKDTVNVAGSSYENMSNLSERFIDRVIRKYEGTRLGRQELHGQVLDDIEGALWTHRLLEENRVTRHPPLIRIVVGVDPKASTEANSETGIIVAGIARDKHVYILDDMTVGGSPADWAKQVVAAYHKYDADKIIGEVNNGGDMVEYTVKSIDDKVAFEQVRASRGKEIRAEPVSSLDEQHQIHHVGMFAGLEDQMCSWIPGELSPDRMDARVWAVWALRLKDEEEKKKVARVR